MIRLRRSVLYVPADKSRALEKAVGLGADVVIIDLEDAVAPDRKDVAREAAVAAAGALAASGKEVVVRINAIDTPWYNGDITEVRRAGISALVLPKVKTAMDVKRVGLRSGLCVWPMLETPQAILEAKAIAEAAASTGPAALILGTNDLCADVGFAEVPGRETLSLTLQLVALAASAAGVDAIDGVCNAIDDKPRLRGEAEQARRLGYTGKTVIHPAQIGPVNRVFSPAPAAVAAAHRVVAAMAEAERTGAAVATLDGRMVESLHARAAERLLAMAAAIEARAGVSDALDTPAGEAAAPEGGAGAGAGATDADSPAAVESIEPVAEAEAVAENEPVAEPEQEAVAEFETVAELEPQPEPDPEPEAAPEVEAAVAELEADAEPADAEPADQAEPAFDEPEPTADEAETAIDELAPTVDEAGPATDEPEPTAAEAETATDEPEPMADEAETATNELAPTADEAETATDEAKPAAEAPSVIALHFEPDAGPEPEPATEPDEPAPQDVPAPDIGDEPEPDDAAEPATADDRPEDPVAPEDAEDGAVRDETADEAATAAEADGEPGTGEEPEGAGRQDAGMDEFESLFGREMEELFKERPASEGPAMDPADRVEADGDEADGGDPASDRAESDEDRRP